LEAYSLPGDDMGYESPSLERRPNLRVRDSRSSLEIVEGPRAYLEVLAKGSL